MSSCDEHAHRNAKLALMECKETLDELGPWAAFKVAKYLIEDLGTVSVLEINVTMPQVQVKFLKS